MKRHPDLVPLSREHHKALVIAKHIAAGIPGSDAWEQLRIQVVDWYDEELQTHFLEEETQLLPQLSADYGDLLRRTLSEHAALNRLAHQLKQGVSDALAEFGDLLEQHVRFEERELFPAMESVWSDGDSAERC